MMVIMIWDLVRVVVTIIKRVVIFKVTKNKKIYGKICLNLKTSEICYGGLEDDH